MNKKDLVTNISEVTEYAKKDVEVVVNEAFTQITNALIAGKEVNIPGFGKFEARQRNARTGRNPQTGEAVEIPAKKAPAFKPAKGLKDSVNS